MTSYEMRWLLRRLRPLRWFIVGSSLSAIAAAGLSTIDPLLMRFLVDTTLPQRRVVASMAAASCIVSCFMGRAGLASLSEWLSIQVEYHLTKRLRRDLVEKLSAVPTDWLEERLAGERVSVVTADVEQLGKATSEAINQFPKMAALFTSTILLMFCLYWKLALALLPMIIAFGWIKKSFAPRFQTAAMDVQSKASHAMGRLTQHVQGMCHLQLLGAERVQGVATIRSWLSLISARRGQRCLELHFAIAVMLVWGLATLTVLAAGCGAVLRRVITVGTLIAFYAYLGRVFDPLSMTMDLYAKMQRMGANIQRILSVLEVATKADAPVAISAMLSPGRAGITMESVSVRYRPDTFALHNVSMMVGGGETVAICGQSGSGKSTIAKLLVRMVEPTSGKVLLAGTPINSFTLRSLRENICYVPQMPFLFNGSVRDNLLLGRYGISEGKIAEVLTAVQLWPVIERLAHGIDTPLGPDAVCLSGGERQRLAIARALLRDCTVLVLDECTSALDRPTEEAVLAAIEQRWRAISKVIISHRLKSLTWVDRLIVVDGGKLVASGSHGDLYSRCVHYRNLYERVNDDGDLLGAFPVDNTRCVVPAAC